MAAQLPALAAAAAAALLGGGVPPVTAAALQELLPGCGYLALAACRQQLDPDGSSGSSCCKLVLLSPNLLAAAQGEEAAGPPTAHLAASCLAGAAMLAGRPRSSHTADGSQPSWTDTSEAAQQTGATRFLCLPFRVAVPAGSAAGTSSNRNSSSSAATCKLSAALLLGSRPEQQPPTQQQQQQPDSLQPGNPLLHQRMRCLLRLAAALVQHAQAELALAADALGVLERTRHGSQQQQQQQQQPRQLEERRESDGQLAGSEAEPEEPEWDGSQDWTSESEESAAATTPSAGAAASDEEAAAADGGEPVAQQPDLGRALAAGAGSGHSPPLTPLVAQKAVAAAGAGAPHAVVGSEPGGSSDGLTAAAPVQRQLSSPRPEGQQPQPLLQQFDTREQQRQQLGVTEQLQQQQPSTAGEPPQQPACGHPIDTEPVPTTPVAQQAAGGGQVAADAGLQQQGGAAFSGAPAAPATEMGRRQSRQSRLPTLPLPIRQCMQQLLLLPRERSGHSMDALLRFQALPSALEQQQQPQQQLAVRQGQRPAQHGLDLPTTSSAAEGSGPRPQRAPEPQQSRGLEAAAHQERWRQLREQSLRLEQEFKTYHSTLMADKMDAAGSLILLSILILLVKDPTAVVRWRNPLLAALAATLTLPLAALAPGPLRAWYVRRREAVLQLFFLLALLVQHASRNFLDTHVSQRSQARFVNAGFAWITVDGLLLQMRFCRQLPTLLACFLLNLGAIPDVCSRYHPHAAPLRCFAAAAFRGLLFTVTPLIIIYLLELHMRHAWLQRRQQRAADAEAAAGVRRQRRLGLLRRQDMPPRPAPPLAAGEAAGGSSSSMP